MPLYDPDSVLKTGHEQIDKEHLQFVALMDNLHNAIISGQGQLALSTCLNELLILASEHFYLEERLMQEAGYPLLKEHSEDHWVFYKKLVSYVNKMDCRETVAIEFISVLMGWFINHVKKSDMDYLPYLQDLENSLDNSVQERKSREQFEPLLPFHSA